MFTNTYLPHVGGVARAVRTARDVLLQRGHTVSIVAPAYDTPSDDERGVTRVPAANAKDGFALPAAIPQLNLLFASVVAGAAVIHIHHPFLLGTIGRDVARCFHKPVVLTYHTMYEHYAHLLDPVDPTLTGPVLAGQAARFCNTIDIVIAPSTDVHHTLQSRGVRSTVMVLPTGVDVRRFANGNRAAARQRYGIPLDAFPVVGCCCRLSKEKSLDVLATAAHVHSKLTFLIVGDGPYRSLLNFPNIVLTGSLSGQELVDAYHAMDVFAFPSVTETQGLVMIEALAAGVPVIGVRSPGVSDVVQDGVNGILTNSHEEFVRKLSEAACYRNGAFTSSLPYSLERYGERLERVYKLAGVIAKCRR